MRNINLNNGSTFLSKTLLIALALVMSLAFSQNSFAQAQKPETKTEAKPEIKVEAPKVIAVEFYADWCNTCKELMPRMAEIRKSYQTKYVMVVRFDMTDDYTKAQASFMASFSGLGEVYKKGGGKTGFIALVDAKTKEILGVINLKKPVEEIPKMIDDAITKTEATK